MHRPVISETEWPLKAPVKASVPKPESWGYPVSFSMKPKVLRAHICPLPEFGVRTEALEHAIGVGVGFDGSWYRSQKEHWLGWLSEYGGPGAYGRDAAQRDGEYIYNHIQCAPMLFWLSQALGTPHEQLDRAFAAVLQAASKGAPQCAALRKILSWTEVECRLTSYRYGFIDKVRIKISTAV